MMAALTLGNKGFSVLCVDPAPPITDAAADGSDLRSTAFLQPAISLFKEVGLWERLAPFAAPLDVMRLVDAGGADGLPRTTRDFVATDMGQESFGYNFPNWLLRREMVAALADRPEITFLPGTSLKDILVRSAEARVALSDGTQVSTPLVIGADGRNSRVRELSNISASTTRYGQKAIVFAVAHADPHENISTEVHRTGGPFTLVPLPDDETGTHRSAVVWMENGPEASRLFDLPDEAFAVAATDRSAGVLGPLTLASARRIWPIVTQVADAITAPRTALIAEAAHVMPPIGAQGLNMSLRDLSELAKLLETARDSGQDLGGPSVLDAYARARRSDIDLRLLGVDLLNRAAMTDIQPLMDLRRRGLEALHGVRPVRQTAMRLGLGAQ